MKLITRGVKVYFKKINGQWYLLKDKERYAYLLNKTAGQVWELSRKLITIEKIVDVFSKRYVIDSKIIYFDIAKFVQALIDEGYLMETSTKDI